MNHIRSHLVECAAEATRIARGIAPEQLSGPSPCKEWTVHDLVNHWVLYTSHGLEHRALRAQLPEELTGRDFAAEPDWAERYAAQLERGVAAWADPAVWEGTVDLGSMALPAPELASLIVKELAVHGWDAARATGQEYRISPPAAEHVLSVVQEHAELYRQYDGFAGPVLLPASASPFDTALAASGRDPDWTP
ncbi:TIGR03086 family metal-binding protein [Streptomyces sp. NPDC059176]|uniref:TIGR03086 family metal-binding protein n=1 Tax=unclassified Streptomyces TaxID=2593676 RepID=UPI0036820A40